MAKNYLFKDALEIINAYNENKANAEVMTEFSVMASKFPKLTAAIMTLDVETILAAMPLASCRQTEKQIMRFVGEGEVIGTSSSSSDEDTDEEEVEKTTAKSAKGKGKDKAKTKAKDEEDEDEDDEDEEDEEESKYAGMKVKALYELCSKRKIKVKEKQDAAYYIEKLENYDAKNNATDEDEDEWEDAPATPKGAKGKGKDKTAKGKGKSKDEDEDDEDDEDWDF